MAGHQSIEWKERIVENITQLQSYPFKKIKKNVRPFIICLFVYEINIDLLFSYIPEGFDGLAVWRPLLTTSQIEFDYILHPDLN